MATSRPKILTSTQAGAILGKSSRTVVRLAQAGEIETVGQLTGPSGPLLFDEAVIAKYAAKIAKPVASTAAA